MTAPHEHEPEQDHRECIQAYMGAVLTCSSNALESAFLTVAGTAAYAYRDGDDEREAEAFFQQFWDGSALLAAHSTGPSVMS